MATHHTKKSICFSPLKSEFDAAHVPKPSSIKATDTPAPPRPPPPGNPRKLNPPRLPLFWRISCSRSHCSLGLRAMILVVEWDQRRPELSPALVTASLNADVEVHFGAHRRGNTAEESACHRLRFGGYRRLHLQRAGLFFTSDNTTSFKSTRRAGLELVES